MVSQARIGPLKTVSSFMMNNNVPLETISNISYEQDWAHSKLLTVIILRNNKPIHTHEKSYR